MYPAAMSMKSPPLTVVSRTSVGVRRNGIPLGSASWYDELSPQQYTRCVVASPHTNDAPALNFVNFTGLTTSLTSQGTFGQFSSTQDPRVMQFALRYEF